MSANRGAWVGDRAFRCHETERPVFLFANNATVVAQEVLEEAVFFANHQSPIAAANAETRLRRVMLAPYGDWPNSRGLQRFQKPDAEEIVKEFSNVVNKLLNPASWLGLPWYEGHPDHPDFRGKPGHTRATAVGRIKSLEAGDDGLYANVKFNEDGERLISNESYHGHSVNWFLTRDKQAANAFRPFRLKSVGFTNEPNIPVPAVTLANAWSDKAREAALLARKEHAVSLSAKANAESEAAKNAGNPQASHTIAKHAHLEAAAAHADAMDDIDSPTSDDFKQHQKMAAWHRRAADRHLRMKHPDQSMNPKPTLNKLREKVGWSNSSPVSRFRAMAQMRQMANAGTSEGAKKGWAKRIGGLTADQHLDKFAHWSDAASLRHASSHREAYNAIAVAHDASALAIKTDHPKDHYKASVAHEKAAQFAKDLGEPTLQRKHEAYSEDHHERGMELDPDGKTFKQSS